MAVRLAAEGDVVSRLSKHSAHGIADASLPLFHLMGHELNGLSVWTPHLNSKAYS